MTLYDGRIAKTSSLLMDTINRSLPIDIKLLPYDVQTNRAWAFELNKLGYFSDTEILQIGKVLDEILLIYKENKFSPLPDDEDVHTLVERILTERLGDTGAKIHTGRSRNDQVACDLRLYLMDHLDQVCDEICDLIESLQKLIEAHSSTLLAGETHMQPAQVITLGHFLSSLCASLMRDCERLKDAKKRAALCPLGSGAIAGAGFNVDRFALAKTLGFSGVLPNSLDAISDRDAAQEATNALAIMATHLSRYAEQFVLWCHPAFSYMRFSNEWSTGSSMMPQKRNPDAMELVRGKSARIISAANSLLILTKGVPLAYAKDLQEDKSALFDAIESSKLIVRVFNGAISSASFNKEKMRAALTGDLLATDLADLLVDKKVPFRKAHKRVALFVSKLEKESRDLLDVSDKEIADNFPELEVGAFQTSFDAALAHRSVTGGCASKCVLDQAKQISQWLDDFKK